MLWYESSANPSHVQWSSLCLGYPRLPVGQLTEPNQCVSPMSEQLMMLCRTNHRPPNPGSRKSGLAAAAVARHVAFDLHRGGGGGRQQRHIDKPLCSTGDFVLSDDCVRRLIESTPVRPSDIITTHLTTSHNRQGEYSILRRTPCR